MKSNITTVTTLTHALDGVETTHKEEERKIAYLSQRIGFGFLMVVLSKGISSAVPNLRF